MQNNVFRNKFINRYADEMNSRYLAENVTSHFLDIHENMYNEMSDHIERWIESEPSGFRKYCISVCRKHE